MASFYATYKRYYDVWLPAPYSFIEEEKGIWATYAISLGQSIIRSILLISSHCVGSGGYSETNKHNYISALILEFVLF